MSAYETVKREHGANPRQYSDYCEGDESANTSLIPKDREDGASRMNLSQETCLELNSSFSGKNDDCSGVALFYE